MKKNEILSLIKTADIAYYKNSSPIMSDFEYDKLRDLYIESYGEKDLDYIAGDNNAKRFEQFTFPNEKSQ